MNKSIFLLAAFGIFVFASCAPISKQAKVEMNKPINCNAAERDIAILKTEKASVVKEIAAGVQNIYPATALIHLLIEQNYKEGWKVASGSYNKAIDAKIAQIKTECKVN